jgi:hypothetical protein
MKVFATLPLHSWHLRIGEGITSEYRFAAVDVTYEYARAPTRST